MASLYEINSELQKAINEMFEQALFSETGEVSQETADKVSELQMARDEKVDNIGAYIKNLKSDVVAIKTEMDNLKDRMDSKKKKIEYLENYLSDILGGEKFESARVKISYRKSEAVMIPDMEALDEEFIKTKTETVADKAAIKEALKAGQEVHGAYLETKNNIQIK